MLQCSGCGEVVSEFAARCPVCGHGVGDALEIAEEPSDAAPEPAPGPYFDEPDPPATAAGRVDAEPISSQPPARRRSRRRRLTVGLAIVVAAATAGITAGLWTPMNSHEGTKGLRSLFGQVVALDGRGAALTYTPATGRTAGYSLDGAPAGFRPMALSPDGTTWLASDGRVAAVATRQVTARSSAVAAAVSSATTPAEPDPFADRSRAVVLMSRPSPAAPAETSIVRISDGRQYQLGIADSAAGDPQSLGAFVSVPVGTRQPRSARPAVADRDVELLRPGHAPRVLASAGQLEEYVGWLPTRSVQLGVYPSPSGEAVAVVLTPLDRVDGDIPMVILDREGGLLAAVDDWSGPMYGSRPVWSPGAHQVAYPTYTTTGPALAIGSETGAIGTVAAPPGTEFGACVWSVSSTDVVCQARDGNRYRWLYALPTANHLISTSSPGEPVAWVASPPP